jgi:hypothetical protein
MITALCLFAGISGLSTFGVVAAVIAGKRTALWNNSDEDFGMSPAEMTKAETFSLLATPKQRH